jgi:hypothetical protein
MNIELTVTEVTVLLRVLNKIEDTKVDSKVLLDLQADLRTISPKLDRALAKAVRKRIGSCECGTIPCSCTFQHY